MNEIPQATLNNIRSVVDACNRGARSRESIGALTGLSPRHSSYAISAAETLGLLGRRHADVVPMQTGRRLAQTIIGSEEERRLLIQAVSNSAIFQDIAPDLLAPVPPSKETIVKNMIRSGLSRSTATHRTAMILKWRRRLLNSQLGMLKEPRQRGMWRRVEIRNFRSIEFSEVDLAPFTIVVGPNGSGKSNFADALIFLRDISADAVAAISTRGGIQGVRRWRPTKPTDVTIDIRAAKTRKALSKTFARHLIKIHSGRRGNWNFTKETIEIVDDDSRNSFMDRDGDVLESNVSKTSGINADASAMVLARQLPGFVGTSPLRNVRRYRLNPEAMRKPQLSSDDSRLDETGENIAVAARSLRQADKYEKIVEPMAKIVPGLQDIYVEQIGRYLTLKFKQRQEEGAVADFNATEMSEGALRALGILVATYQMARDELLIIEEPEVSIHVGAANVLFDILKEAAERGSVLITTHSADLLDLAREEEILVCEYVDGSTRIGPMAETQRKIVRDGLFSVSELMRSEPLRIEGGGESNRSIR
jgi:predicted ATPase